MRRRIEAKDLPRRTMPFRRPFTTTTAVQVFIYSREFSQNVRRPNNKTSEDISKKIISLLLTTHQVDINNDSAVKQYYY